MQHFGEQVEQTDKWLDGCIKVIAKLNNEMASFDGLVNSFINSVAPPITLSEAIVDHDYSLLAVCRHGDISRESWSAAASSFKKLDVNIAEPLRTFLQTDLRSFREQRRQLEQSQRLFDASQARYSAQPKSKESSALREDAFQLHEARKAYLKASLDFACAAPQLKTSLDRLLITCFSAQSRTIRMAQDNSHSWLLKAMPDVDRTKAWTRALADGEREYRLQLLAARRQVEDAAEISCRPSREIDDYSSSVTSNNLANGRTTAAVSSNPATISNGEKQGWLNLKATIGKPGKTVWNRRWFYLRGGIFGWFVQGSRSGGVEESDRFGVLLCGIRDALSEERRFCFEVKTKDGAIIVQADSPQDRSHWIAAFEGAKQKALADPTHSRPATGSLVHPELAFVISPPSAPEFAASATDAGLSADESHDRGHGHLMPSTNDQIVSSHRGSSDILAARRSTGVDGVNSREQPTNIIQKLDLHRKPVASSTAAGSTATTAAIPSGSGIATLISASNMALPLGPGAVSQNPSILAVQPSNRLNIRSLPASPLAPRALANPPNATNLSWTAAVVNGERGASLGWTTSRASIPNVISANLWGSSPWAHVQWLEQSDGSPPNPISTRPLAWLEPGQPGGDRLDPSSAQTAAPDAASRLVDHRKTVSLDGDVADLQRAAVSPLEPPQYYPPLLKHQDSQFRLFFPGVPDKERLLLVFRGAWALDGANDLPGRFYLTNRALMFYCHHFGMVLTTGLLLERISDVAFKRALEFDLLALHLKRTENLGIRQSAIKTFLEPVQVLQKRLSLVIKNANANDSNGIETSIKELLQVETSGTIETGEESGAESPPETESKRGHTTRTPRHGRLRAHLVVDQGLEYLSTAHDRKESVRFKLPNKPVVYTPRGWTLPVVESDFPISPKALFHVMFGDRSAVWQLLYGKRHAQNIKQGPWMRESDSHLYRAFEYCIERRSTFGSGQRFRVNDTQTIDVLSDHLCYVITYRKTPWHLPHFRHLSMITKVVISFEAKSRSRLAIYAKAEWLQRPLFTAALVEEQVLRDIKSDASDIGDLVAQQARRLGPGPTTTKKAIEIFGSIGQQTQVVEYSGGGESMFADLKFTMAQRSVASLFGNSALSFTKRALNLAIVSLSWVAEWGWDLADNANTVLAFVLTASLVFNTLQLAQPLGRWLEQRQSIKYMERLGVGGRPGMSRSILLSDIEAASTPANMNNADASNSLW